MKLGLALPWANPQVKIPIDLVKHAEALGFDSVWTAEIYGQDAITPLAWIAAQTERIRLGTAVIQAAARTPASTALSMSTVDQLAGGGRVIIGVGLSGPQIVEGWYGMPWGSPNRRLRDYVEIMRKVLKREGPVTHDGPEIRLPYDGPGSSGLGKPLKSVLHTDPETPIFELDPELAEKLRGLVRADFRLHFAHGLEYFAEVDFPGCVDSELSQAGGIVF